LGWDADAGVDSAMGWGAFRQGFCSNVAKSFPLGTWDARVNAGQP
jgi:hypothetical protein